MSEAPELLVPFDGSPAAERLLRRACRVALADRAGLAVLCVVALPAAMAPDEAPINLSAGVMQALVRAQEICREEGVVASFELNYAHDLADAILGTAQRTGTKLICLSLDEHRRGDTALMSRTVQSVLASSPCSVLLADPASGLPPSAHLARNGR